MTAYSLRTKCSVEMAPRVPEARSIYPNPTRPAKIRIRLTCMERRASLHVHEARTSREVVDEAHRVHLEWDRGPT
jgi:hypothetical protein